MMQRGALGKALAYLGHGNGREHLGVDAELAKGGRQSQRVDNGCQHAHVIAGNAVAPLRGHGDTAEDVATADHDADFDPHCANLGDIACYTVNDRDIDTEPLFAHEGFARGFEENALEQGCCRHELIRILCVRPGYTKGTALSRDALRLFFGKKP
jgi:hypothetical protein